MSKTLQIKPGQKFRKSEGLLWEVDTLSNLSISIPHVKMVGVSDRSVTKIIAASVLLDRNRFEEMPAISYARFPVRSGIRSRRPVSLRISPSKLK